MPLPRWRDEPASGRKSIYRLKDFQTYQAFRLRSDWSELEMNLRSVFTHFADQAWFDLQSAEEAVEIIDHTRTALETAHPNAELVDDDLGRARRLLVWLVPPVSLEAQAVSIKSRLEASGNTRASEVVIDAHGEELRFQLEAAIDVLNDIASAWTIDNALQQRRLEAFRNAAVIALVVAILLAPILVNRASLAAWALTPLDSLDVLAWLTTIGVAAVGAMAALLSDFHQLRDKPVTYADYQVRGIEVAVRAAVGSTVAVVAYYLLSFNVMPGMSVASPGTYLLVAFAAGFSERYVLGLLKLDSSSSSRPPSSMTPSATSMSTASTASPGS